MVKNSQFTPRVPVRIGIFLFLASIIGGLLAGVLIVRKGIGQAAWRVRVVNLSPQVTAVHINNSNQKNIKLTFHREDPNEAIDFPCILTNYTSSNAFMHNAIPDLSTVRLSVPSSSGDSQSVSYRLSVSRIEGNIVVATAVPSKTD